LLPLTGVRSPRPSRPPTSSGGSSPSGLAGSVWQGIKHAQRAYRAQDKQDKLEEAAWAIGIPAISAGVYWFSIKIGIINPVWTLGNLPTW
jgi:hypothetical protein